MIKNIVFDMGHVLCWYNSDGAPKHYIEQPEYRRNVLYSVFLSQEWLKLDMGMISEEEALKKMTERLETEEEKHLAELCFRDWHIYNEQPIPGMEELVREIKNVGLSVYMISNASVRMAEIYKEVLPGWEMFDGLLFSGEVKYIKPQREIYEIAFSRFQIKPEESFFIDDAQTNIDGARLCGMDGYCFADGDIEKLKNRIREVTSRTIS